MGSDHFHCKVAHPEKNRSGDQGDQSRIREVSRSLLKNSFGILSDHNILGLFIAGIRYVDETTNEKSFFNNLLELRGWSFRSLFLE